jgi:hydrogenase-4 component B
MIALFLVSLTLHGLALLLPVFLRNNHRLSVVSNLANATAAGCGLGFSLSALLAYQRAEYSFDLPAVGHVPIGFDGLTLFFLFTFQLLSIAGSLYAIGYLRHYIERGYSVRGHLWFFTLFILSLQLVLVVQNAIVFLIVWELMAIAAYFSIVCEWDKEEVRRGGFWYLVATHASVLLLLVCFLVLHEVTGSWSFDDFARHTNYDPKAVALILLTGFAGFGIKAGFMPFRVAAKRASGSARSCVWTPLSD